MVIRTQSCIIFQDLAHKFTRYCTASYRLTHSEQKEGEKIGNGLNNEASRVDEVVKKWSERFKSANISEHCNSASLIVAHALGKKMLHEIPVSQIITKHQLAVIDRLCQQRMDRMPVQYIIGEWDFHDLTLKMRPPVFIPRTETEELAGVVCADLEKTIGRCGSGKFLEFGCGSGALSLHILNQFKQICAVAIDKSTEACDLTTENARMYDLLPRLSVIPMDYSLPESTDRLKMLGPFDLLIANPPYIPSTTVQELEPEVIRYEDTGALDGGQDGLDFVRIIIALTRHTLKPTGRLWLEVDLGHTDKIRSIVESSPNLHLRYVASLKDYTSRDRFCVLEVTEI